MKKRFTTLMAAALAVALLWGCSPKTETVVAEAAQSGNSDMAAAAALIQDIPTTQYFTDAPVDTNDLNTILLAGANAPSAMNGQPWHFSAITDAEVLARIAGGMSFGGPPAGMPEGADLPEGPGDGEMPEIPGGLPEGGDMPAPPTGAGAVKAGVEDAPLVIVVSCKAGSEFDAGLACQNMSAEAQLLGYGTKIVSAPTMAINAEGQEALRAELGIPEGYTACALLLVGQEDTAVDTEADTYAAATVRNPLEDIVTYLNP